jgi:hypothetical protein
MQVKGASMSNEIELSISCNDCVRRGTPDCEDCLVSFVLGETPDELVMTSDDADVVQLFTAQGMMPRLKFQRRMASLEPVEGSRTTE